MKHEWEIYQDEYRQANKREANAPILLPMKDVKLLDIQQV